MRLLTKIKQGDQFVAVVEDRGTKLTKTVSYCKNWVSSYTNLSKLPAVNNPQYVSCFLVAECPTIRMNRIIPTKYHLRTNGEENAIYFTLLSSLHYSVSEQQTAWDKYRLLSAYAYNLQIC